MVHRDESKYKKIDIENYLQYYLYEERKKNWKNVVVFSIDKKSEEREREREKSKDVLL